MPQVGPKKSSPVIVQSFEVAGLKYLRSKTRVRLVQLIDADDVDKNGNLVLNPPLDRPYDFTVAQDHRTFKDLVSKAGLAEIKTYADGVGPWKRYIVSAKQIDANGDGQADDLNGDGKIDERDRVLLAPSNLIKDAHDLGLFVHTWTFRNEPRRLAADFKGDPLLEYKMFYALGIDGVFSDFADTAVKARRGRCRAACPSTSSGQPPAVIKGGHQPRLRGRGDAGRRARQPEQAAHPDRRARFPRRPCHAGE